MVGLKTFWILFTLFVLASCVPQTKQTECANNEAFNASLRTCVPIVGGPSSFVKINTYSPASVIAKSKGDTTTQSFSITISNPYSQAYSIQWERVFNGSPVALSTCNDMTTCSAFSPYTLGTSLGQIGLHVITAKILVGATVVDTHNFELKVDDFPKPTIRSASILPSATIFNIRYTPTDGAQTFSFVVQNNNGLLASDNWLVDWTVSKNGVALTAESDYFTDLTSTGTNTATLDSPLFNPSAAGYGIGSYTIRAVVRNNPPFPNPVQIVDERLWTVTVAHPDLSQVTNVSSPVAGVSTTAYDGVAYPDYPTYAWLITSTTTQPQYCVSLNDADGTYPSDGLGLSVRWYLDGIGTEIYSKSTALPLEPAPGASGTYCLIDGTFASSLLKFTNASSTSAQLHKVTVRIFDERTSLELQPSNVLSGTYPIEWSVNVKPINSAPVATFGTLPAGCVTSGSYTKNSCPVTQGTPFNISFSVNDDFYKPSTTSAKFMWDLKLVSTLTGTDVITYGKYTSASKAFAGALPANCSLSSETWTCSLEVPHYTAAGPLNPNGPYQVVLTLQDQDSPVGGAGMTAVQMKWNLIVTETNGGTSPVITAQTTAGASNIYRSSPTPVVNLDPAGSNYVTELDYISFNIGVQDSELDDFDYAVYVCGSGSTSATCLSPQIVTPSVQSYVRSLFPAVDLTTFTPTTSAVTVAMPSAYKLTETLLLSDLSQDVDTSTSVPVYFQVTVTDKPTTLPLASRVTDNKIFTAYVRNYNPAPTFATSGQVPAFNTAGTTYTIMSGFPFTIDPGTITDSSTAAAEKNTITYGWYANDGLGWQLIDGSTNKSKLVWTPSHLATGTIEIKVCIGDNTQANKVVSPVTAGANCSSSWFFTPRSFLAKPTPAATNVSSEVAVWKDTGDGDASREVIYSAYIGADNNIYVNKTVIDTNSSMNATDTQTVSFNSLSSGIASSVSNISLTGTTDSLYVAYLAVDSLTGNLVPRVRRINKSFGVEGTKSGYVHAGKFGFTYAEYSVDVSGCTTCAYTTGSATVTPKITFSSPGVTTGETVVINGVTFSANYPVTLSTEFCSVAACSASEAATSLAAKINAINNSSLQGMTAVASGTDVFLYGARGYDHLDWDGTNNTINTNVPTGQMGKIFVVGNQWYIPFVNSALPVPNMNNISILSGTTDVMLQDTTTYPVQLTNIATGSVAIFDAEHDPTNDDLVVAYTAYGTSSARLLRLKYDGATKLYNVYSPNYVIPIFSGSVFTEIKVAAQATGNSNVFVFAKDSTSAYHMGRYPAGFTNVSSPLFEDLLSNRLVTTDMTSTYISDALISNPVLKTVPSTSDARLFFNSGSASRVARFRSDNLITCGDCASIGYSGTDSHIAVSDVSTLTLGNAGLVGENVRNSVFVLMNYTNGAAQEPLLGLINLHAESIQSTTVNSIWRPPFSK